jgi:hypothetical protein
VSAPCSLGIAGTLPTEPTPMTDPLNINTTLQPLWPNWYMILCYWLNLIMWAWVITAEFLMRLPMSVSTAQRFVHHRRGLRIVWFILTLLCVTFHFIPPLQPSVFFYFSCFPLVVVSWWGAGDLRALELKAKARIVEQHLLAESRMDSAIESATFNRLLPAYYFMKASTVLSWGRASSPPRFQDLQKRGLLDCVSINILSAYQNGVEDTLLRAHFEKGSVESSHKVQYRPATTTRNTATQWSRRSAHFEKGSVESTHKVPTSHYHTKHCATQWSRRSVD